MNGKNIVITQSDFEKLARLLKSFQKSSHRDQQHLQSLSEELDSALVVDAAEAPHDVVTMNSRVRVKDLNTRQEFECQVVFPRDADLEKNQISVLAPIGTALLGYCAGDTIEWQVPSGIRRLQILGVQSQPDARALAA